MDNSFTGSIPSEVGRMEALEKLDLSDNAWSGTLPSELGDLKHLQSLRINRARGGLGGPLPSFSGASKIDELELAFNRFTGSVPHDLLKGRRHDGELKIKLSMNLLEGEIPSDLSRFTNVLLEIEDNKITGIADALCQQSNWMGGETALVTPRPCDAILCPSGFWSPTGRASTSSGVECEPCEGNQYFGESVCEVGGLQSNTEVEILDNLFLETGGWYWNTSHTNWTKSGVPICYREGVVCGWKPAGMNSGVTELRLTDYGLRGRIPTEIFQLPKLRRFVFSKNPVDISFEGFEQASNLEIISLSHTNVQSLAGMENAPGKLYSMDVSSAKLKGTFPSDLLQSNSLFTHINLDDNQLTGPIVSEISRLTKLQHLSLGNNLFSSTLPSELALLTELTHLKVNDNRLSGLLPTELEDLPHLVQLNVGNQLSANKLSGSLLSFPSTSSLNYVNMSSNAFTGNVPDTMLDAVDKRGASLMVDLSSNELIGGFPLEFNAFQQLNINLAANKIDALPPSVCENLEWMGGITGVVVSEHRCDTILCHPGTITASGWQEHRDHTCQACASVDEAPYFGSISCSDPMAMVEREGTFDFVF